MTRGCRESAGGRCKKRRKMKKRKRKDLIMAAVARISWMLKVKDCHHACLFCRYYRKCREDGIQKEGEI